MEPAVEQRLRAIAAECGQLVCQRSAHCCGVYGLDPLDDCTSYWLNEILHNVYVSMKSNDDPSTFDYAVDETMAKACLDGARALINQCVLVYAEENAVDAWWRACWGVGRATRKGATPAECRDDSGCVIARGASYRCVDSRCLPEVEVSTGEPCGYGGELIASVPVCSAADFCTSTAHTCQRRADAGQECSDLDDYLDDSCVSGYGCVGGTCVPRVAEGQPCHGSQECQEGAECRRNSAESMDSICLSTRGFGEPCTYAGQCPGLMTCTDGTCRPQAISFCAPPAEP